jgi:hypothetical protein
VSRDLAADVSAPDVSDIGDVEPELVDQGDGGEPLPPAIASRMRELLHHDFAHVRLHTDAATAHAAAALGARAFTLGNHIYFNRDQFTPDTPSGRRSRRSSGRRRIRRRLRQPGWPSCEKKV